ncbi:homoserine O-acetyltransferase [Zafaria sp. J156]|nr:homoserine O-acetyltransferase [Zafaria sp. J156]MEE1620038.1 homoserine O-acetyltransferase [Zafaria sp. J156]
MPSGDGILRVLRTGAFAFETGGFLPAVDLAYETWGRLNADASNAVLLQHALTGDTHVARGDGAEPGWWDGFIGPGRTIDTERYFVVAANMVGGCYGSTGPSSPDADGVPWGSRFPFTTIRDSVRLEARLADELGIDRWHAVVGGSMGGARALEWAAEFPHRVGHCVVVAATAQASAEQIAFAQAQSAAIRLDPGFAGGDYYDAGADPGGTAQGARGPVGGLGIARRIAHVTYRSEPELESRFGRAAQPGESPLGSATSERGRYQVESYLDHQADKLAARFDANSYLVLTEALMSHDVGRGRGGVEAALARLDSTRFFIAAVTSDRLYWPEQSERLAALLPGRPPVHAIDSPIGHDGFLTDITQLDAPLRATVFAG